MQDARETWYVIPRSVVECDEVAGVISRAEPELSRGAESAKRSGRR